ncbi:DUF2726 domain-containing protein [Candidatus Nomurabacteria bacterium]|nr:DUF2726 domain-containing protein [Candidatus Nomurabacteria bacterium]USN94978.1 MAG: DUF2726 domain-containing protein [Candidatus Nomurabacteria bacterium]
MQGLIKIFITIIVGTLLVTIFPIIWKIISGNKEEVLKDKKPIYKYSKKKFLITKSEAELFNLLIQEFGNKYYIFPQVHLSSFLDHKIKGQNWSAALSHIQRKSVDFLICDKEYITPLVAIELDDKSHEREDRKERDFVVEKILESANIKLVRIKKEDQYNIDKIKSILEI